MKTAVTFFLLTIIAGISATVEFNLRDIIQTSQSLKLRTAVIEPLSTVKANTISNTVILSERRIYNTGTNASFTATNLIDGLYRVYVYGNNATSVFRVNIPSTNGTVYASDYLTSGNPFAVDTEDGLSIEIE